MNNKTKKLTTLAMLCAIAYVVMVVGRVPAVLFLKYDPKDVIITLGGLIYGPLSAAAISLIVSLIEMFTVSDTGWIGLIMNILSTCAFACVASLIYKKKRTLTGAVIGLAVGTLVMSGVMVLWNYLITPLYMHVPREQIAGMLLPTFLPFNLVKGGLNSALTYLLYKPVITGLRKAGILEPSTSTAAARNKSAVIVFLLLALVVLATCILCILSWQGII